MSSSYFTTYSTAYGTPYRPGSGSAVIPLDLVDAVELRLNQLLVTPGYLTWAGPGDLPPGLSMPFASIGDLDEDADYQEDGSGHAPYDDLGTFAVRVAASTSSAAKSLRDRVASALTDVPLVFGDGTLLLLRRTSRGAPICEDEDAPIGEQTWIAHLMFATIVLRTL